MFDSLLPPSAQFQTVSAAVIWFVPFVITWSGVNMSNVEVATGRMSCHVTLLRDVVKMQILIPFIRVSTSSYSTLQALINHLERFLVLLLL